jgi:predicted DNA-binding transcriptional regulator YafY
MKRSSNTDKTHRLNAAFHLLAQGYPLAEAAEALTQQFGLSRRQAYRYLQEAQAIDAPVLIASPSIPITIKIPADVVKRLRSHAQTSGMTIGEIVAQAIVSFLDKLHRHG